MSGPIYCAHCGQETGGKTHKCAEALLLARVEAAEARVQELEKALNDIVRADWVAGDPDTEPRRYGKFARIADAALRGEGGS